MIQLNLLPDVKKEYLNAKATRRKVISGAILLTMISGGILIALGIFLGTQKGLVIYETGQINQKADQLASIENIDEYLTIQSQLAQIDGLHASKMNTSRLFTALSNVNPADPNSVTFSSVNVDVESTTLTFQGGTRSISALTTFRDTLLNAQLSYTADEEGNVREPLFEAVTISEYGYSSQSENSSTRVGFTVTALYNASLFDTASTNVRVTVPDIETTQSVQNAPQVRFEAGAGDLGGSDD